MKLYTLLKCFIVVASGLYILISLRIVHHPEDHLTPIFNFVSVDSHDEICKTGYRYIENMKGATSSTSLIPKQIHVVTRSKCLSTEQTQALEEWNKNGYSVVFYNERDANDIIQQYRRDFPHLISTARCMSSGIFKTELVKLLLLYDFGGVVIDLHRIRPTEILQHSIVEKGDEFVLIMRDAPTEKDIFYFMEYLASSKAHPFLYTLIQKVSADLFVQYSSSPLFPQREITHSLRRNHHLTFIMKYIFATQSLVKGQRAVYSGMNSTVTVVSISDKDEPKFFPNATSINAILELDDTRSQNTSCIDWNESTIDEDEILKSLQDLTDMDITKTCPSGQIFIKDIIERGSYSKYRKIPKVIHLTSKTRCVTKSISDNINTWKLKGYSLFFHDDASIVRLFSQDWPEFPQLKDVLLCITSGAGWADLFRYLVLWKYGGIYSDVDNAPGDWFQNGTLITDKDDAFFEIEAAKFPSQYFMAASPRHPVMFNSIQSAIQNLFHEQNIVRQYVPLTSGPGALKYGVHYTIGNAYPEEGIYSSFHPTRSITFVGNRTSAMRRNFIRRKTINAKELKNEYHQMNMSHYSYAGRQKELPQKSCLEVVYDVSMKNQNASILGLNRLLLS